MVDTSATRSVGRLIRVRVPSLFQRAASAADVLERSPHLESLVACLVIADMPPPWISDSGDHFEFFPEYCPENNNVAHSEVRIKASGKPFDEAQMSKNSAAMKQVRKQARELLAARMFVCDGVGGTTILADVPETPNVNS